MKRNWTEEELVERWTLFPDELALVDAKTGHTRLGFAVMLRFFAGDGRFPSDKHEVPADVLRFVGEQVGVPDAGLEGWLRYDWTGRAIKYHRAQIRELLGFREATVHDGEEVASWLLEEVLPREQDEVKLREAFHERCRTVKIEPPTLGRVDRLISSASRRFEERFCASVFGRLPEEAFLKMDAVLVTELTRWGRSTQDLMDTLGQLASWDVSLVAQTGLTFDLSTPQGKLIANLMASLAEFEHALLRERVRSGIAAAKAKGQSFGRKRGYRPAPTHKFL